MYVMYVKDMLEYIVYVLVIKVDCNNRSKM